MKDGLYRIEDHGDGNLSMQRIEHDGLANAFYACRGQLRIVEDANRRLGIELGMAKSEAGHSAKQVDGLRSQLADCEIAAKDRSAVIQLLEKQVSDLKDQLRDSREQEENSDRAFDALKAEFDAAQRELEKSSKASVEREALLSDRNERIERAEKAEVEARALRSELEYVIGQLRVRNSELEQLRGELNASEASEASDSTARSELSRAWERIQRLESERDSFREDARAARSSLDDSMSALRASNSEAARLGGELDDANRSLVSERATNEGIRAELSTVREQLEDALDQRNVAVRQARELKVTLYNCRAENDAQNKRASELEAELAAKSQRIAELEAEMGKVELGFIDEPFVIPRPLTADEVNARYEESMRRERNDTNVMVDDGERSNAGMQRISPEEFRAIIERERAKP